MKKIISLLVLTFMFLTLVACDSVDEITHQTTQNNGEIKNEQTEDSIKATQKVELTKENYSKYIATYTRQIATENGATYYYDFEGASCCKFENAKIKYCFSNDDEIPEDATIYTCELNLSGCGQSKGASISRGRGDTKLIIIDVQGTVEILQ